MSDLIEDIVKLAQKCIEQVPVLLNPGAKRRLMREKWPKMSISTFVSCSGR
jgi:hypothetical protein